MSLQKLTTQADLIKAARRDDFKHRLCSMSMIPSQTGSEVFVESFGYGEVESDTFLYSSAYGHSGRLFMASRRYGRDHGV
eukprot:CAMPEP_0119016876 /NCGR_PEP_ID=MMETSP1176-20130426/14656_1 /TAXON_ID=265551 /ORGANISM="Synedropsis recta cf, Strain CCMP1620" /LENGTH=79 /DNA_ID=CAMNT_0006970425 /DNA_START=302 /DNA_END=538 /DNA_ORIENTATION=+